MATTFKFPIYGLYKGFGVSPPPDMTSPALQNVRPYSALTSRCGGQRPGLNKWGAGTLIGGDNQPIVAMCIVNSVE